MTPSFPWATAAWDLGRLGTTARSVLSRFSPRARRWRRHLQSLILDPDQLPLHLDPPEEPAFLICGVPRSGTTLAAAVLFQPPAVFTVMEPWDGLRLAPAQLFRSLRQELETTSTCRRGKLRHDVLLDSGRVEWGAEGESAPSVTVSPQTRLGVKWPAFWRYLPLLPRTRFLVCVRDPREVLRSFVTQGGRLARGLEYDVAFHAAMNRALTASTCDDAVRRALLWEYITSRIVPFLDRPNVYVLRYERWFSQREQVMTELSEFLGTKLAPGPARLEQPRAAHRNAPDPALEELILRHCPSARQLGYGTS